MDRRTEVIPQKSIALTEALLRRLGASCLIASVLGLTEISPTLASDRPSVIPRTFLRTRPKSPVPADVPPSPTKSSEQDESSQSAKLASHSTQSSKATESNRMRDDTASLTRFPMRSGETSAKAPSGLVDFNAGLDQDLTPIDLPAALQLGGWNSPEVLLVQQRVVASSARQQLAAAQALPNLNIGMNFDEHTGALQRASGLILNIQRSSLYLGAGANAVAAGTVNIPGLQYNLNVGETYFGYLVSRQQTERAKANASATRNNVLLQIASAYCQLVRAQGTRAIALQAKADAVELARITASFAKVGQGLPADAERAATEVGRREADVFAADAGIAEAAATLGQVLNLEPAVRLRSNENWIVPRAIVPDPIPLPELIAISLYQRPEVAANRAEVHSAMLELDSARLLIFSPQFIAGYSAGAFGGGGDVNANATGAPRFGDFGSRNDQDLVLYWSIRNLGLANRALIKTATARLAASDFERMKTFNQIRAEVASAYARTQSNAAKLDVRHEAVVSSERGFQEDLRRARAAEGRPIEVLDSLRLRARAQQDYLDTIATYNLAQYELYVAIGQPPADLLVHTEPPSELPAPAVEVK